MIDSRLAAYIFASLILFLAGWYAVRPSGHISATYNLQGYNFAISKPFPFGRLTEVRPAKPSGYQQEILAEPIYLNLRSVRPMDKANLTIWFKGQIPANWSLGVLTKADPTFQNSSYSYYKINTANISPAEDGWLKLNLGINLRSAVLDKGSYRLALSVPSYDQNTSPLTLHRIAVEMDGPKYSIMEIVSKGIRRIDSCFFYDCR
jgi:hypothetical protein